MLTDAELLSCYVEEKSDTAFAELVRRYVDLVYSAALRQLGGDAHRAQDVTQVVFTTLARKAGSLTRHPVLTGWLYTTTHHAAAKAIRTEMRRQAREQRAHAMNENLANDDAAIDWEQVRPVLDDAMRELGDRDREAVLLRYFAQRPFAEIGAALKVSEDAARMRVERALARLEVLLARRGVTSAAGALAVGLTQQAVLAAPVGLAAAVSGAALTASATAVAGPMLAGVVHFMATSKLAVGIGGMVLIAAAVGIATHESGARHAAEEVRVALTRDVAGLEAEERDVQQRIAAAEQALRETRTALTAAEAQATVPAAPAGTAPVDPRAAGREFLARHPEAQQLWDERERANWAARFAPIYRMMNLSPAQREQIEGVFLRTIAGTTSVAVPGGSIALRREATLMPAEAEAQLQGVLGAEGYTRFQELSKFAPTFDFTVKLASALYRTEPLSAEQTDRVMQIFAAASPAAKGIQPGRPATIDWSEISAQAREVLSPPQLAALKAVQHNFEYQQAVYKLSRAAEEAATPAKGSTSSPR